MHSKSGIPPTPPPLPPPRVAGSRCLASSGPLVSNSNSAHHTDQHGGPKAPPPTITFSTTSLHGQHNEFSPQPHTPTEISSSRYQPWYHMTKHNTPSNHSNSSSNTLNVTQQAEPMPHNHKSQTIGSSGAPLSGHELLSHTVVKPKPATSEPHFWRQKSSNSTFKYSRRAGIDSAPTELDAHTKTYKLKPPRNHHSTPKRQLIRLVL
uniref:Uncharacterized protein n=1 Tax=Ditylenchus dipsaci TaxID=166011 RepID=A0A915D9C3_9BILA